MGDISKNFSVSEFIYSDTAKQKGINNIPDKQIEENLKQLVINVLQPARDFIGKSITVNSGYRCPELNKAIGGASKSDHMGGYAADITTHNHNDNEALFIWIKENCKYKQLIWENNGQWIHVAYKDGYNKGEVLSLIQ